MADPKKRAWGLWENTVEVEVERALRHLAQGFVFDRGHQHGKKKVWLSSKG